eukprot:scaffold300_cov258-Pinguiococcus_pyrenoidosus.AAC.44
MHEYQNWNSGSRRSKGRNSSTSLFVVGRPSPSPLNGSRDARERRQLAALQRTMQATGVFAPVCLWI